MDARGTLYTHHPWAADGLCPATTVQTMDPMQDDPQRGGEDEVVGDDEVVDLDWEGDGETGR